MGNRPAATQPSTRVYDSRTLVIGRFRCPADHRAWRELNSIGSRPLIVFPRVPVRIKHDDKPAVVADANCVMFYNADQMYQRGLLDRRGDACEFYALGERLLAEIVAEFHPADADQPRAPFSFCNGPSDPHSYLRQREVFEYVTRSDQPEQLLVEETVLMVVRGVLALAFAARGMRGRPRSARTDRAHRDVTEAAKEALARRFNHRLSLDEISDTVHVSPFHLCRIFRRHTGFSLHQYLSQLRLRSSLEALAEGEADLTRLALRLGYSSHAHFTFAFRQAFGTSPSQVRCGSAARRLADQMSRNLKADRPATA